MATDPINGARYLMTEFREELDKKGKTNGDRLMMKGILYLLESLPAIRQDIHDLKQDAVLLKNEVIERRLEATEMKIAEAKLGADMATLKQHDLITKIMEYPKTSIFILLTIGVVNSMIDWQSVGSRLFGLAVKAVTGLDIPLVTGN